MFTAIHPKLPMHNKAATLDFYVNTLQFEVLGSPYYPEYLMVQKDNIELHFFLYEELDPKENYGQVYIRVADIDTYYQSLLDRKVTIHPDGKLQSKPWGQKEFALLDPTHNLLTFGQST